MLLVISWIAYIVCFILAMVVPMGTLIAWYAAAIRKPYIYITIWICSVMCMVVMMMHYGVWRVLAIQALGGMLCAIRGAIVACRISR